MNNPITTTETDEYVLSYEDGPETHKLAYDTLLAWFKDTELFHGDSIHQTDVTYVVAPILLTKLAEEVFKFDRKWKD